MTIDAIHSAFVGRRNLLRRARTIAIVVLGDVALLVLYTHPENHLAMFVGRDIVNLVGDVHVPVDSGYQAGCRTAAADIYQHTSLAHGVLLVKTVIGENL